MIQFEETVVRCEEWLKKQKKFEETFFAFDPEPRLKELTEKI
jgi:3-methyladenine DNA glycosylase Tag